MTNSRRMSQRVDTPDVLNSGVEEGGIVGVKTTRLEKRVDSECWEWILRVARWMEEAERRAIEDVTFSEVSRVAVIYIRLRE